MSKVYPQKNNKNISLTDRHQRLIRNSCQHWRHVMLTSRITEGENRHFKINTDHHNGDLIYVFFFFNCLDKHDYIWNLTQGELSIINASFIFFHPWWPDSRGYMILMPSDLISRQALELLRPSSVPSTISTDLPNPMMVPQARIFSLLFFFFFIFRQLS